MKFERKKVKSIRLKGILAGNTVRASFLETEWEQRQREFEEWLEGLGDCEASSCQDW